jgi:hypothetical protein
MRIALRKAPTPLDLVKRGASAGPVGWLRQERISVLFNGERLSLRDPLPGTTGKQPPLADEPLR